MIKMYGFFRLRFYVESQRSSSMATLSLKLFNKSINQYEFQSIYFILFCILYGIVLTVYVLPFFLMNSFWKAFKRNNGFQTFW